MDFEVFSQLMAQDAEWLARNSNINRPHIWISISGEDPAKLPSNENRMGELFLQFDDVNESNYKSKSTNIKECKLMTDEQANQIIDFVISHLKSVELICVNCNAGISRSAGVASALSLLTNEYDGIGNNKRFHPNSHVKSLVVRNGTRLHDLVYGKHD